MRSIKWINAIVALTVFVGAGYTTACTGNVESGGDEERVGEVDEAVGAGQACGVFVGESCDSGLTCCGGSFYGSGICRDLNSDPNNCGGCGVACSCSGSTPHAVCWNRNCLCLP